jgi:hypothetical protein
MEEYKAINKKLMDVCRVERQNIFNIKYETNGLSLVKLRDILIRMGRIHSEDFDNSCYVAVIPGGIAKKNYAIIVLELQKDILRIAAYADEGIIYQHTCEGIIDEIEKNIRQYII